MAGRRPSSYKIGLQKVVDLPIFLVKYQPIIPEKARRTYYDGKKLHRLTSTTISQGLIIFENEFEKCKEELSKLGYKKIIAEQLTTAFPTFCPKCDNEGNPHLRLLDKVPSAKDSHFKKRKIKFKLYYQHSKKNSQCFIGYFEPPYHLKVSKGINIRKMDPFYRLKEREVYEFELPKKKKKPVKKLV